MQNNRQSNRLPRLQSKLFESIDLLFAILAENGVAGYISCMKEMPVPHQQFPTPALISETYSFPFPCLSFSFELSIIMYNTTLIPISNTYHHQDAFALLNPQIPKITSIIKNTSIVQIICCQQYIPVECYRHSTGISE